MKKTSKSFIWGSIFDVISTIFALNQGCVEMNIFVNRYGWFVGYAVKILGTIFIVYVLERVKGWWFSWIVPILMWLIVVWNVINGIVEMIQ